MQFRSLTPFLVGGASAWALARRYPIVPSDLQVLALTDTTVTISWINWDTRSLLQLRPRTAAAAGVVRVWPAGRPGEVREVEVHEAFPLVTVDNLRPDTLYCYEAYSADRRVWATHNRRQEKPRHFSTLPQLTGEPLATIVVANDTHIGEFQDGKALSLLPPPAVRRPHMRPHPEICLEAVIENAHAVGASHLFLNGDVTDRGTRSQEERALKLVRTFRGRCRAVRGNHDCGPDPLTELFGPPQQAWVEEIPGTAVRVVGIDSSHHANSGGVISEAQFAQIEGYLREDPARPTILMLHHPATREAAHTHPNGKRFILRDADVVRLETLISRAPGVVLVLSGHTHRARRTRSQIATHATFVENGSTKNWPCGALQIRLYRDGASASFLPNRTPLSREWAARTRWGMLGYSPSYMLGPVDARNFVVRFPA